MLPHQAANNNTNFHAVTSPRGETFVRKLLALGLVLASTQSLALQYQIQQLPALSVGGFATADGLNDNGMVVGQALNASSGQLEAVVWNNGSISSLGFQGKARDVNNSGTVVGETGLALSVQIATGRAFKWDATNGYVDLGDLGGPNAGAYSINENGVITGFSMQPNVPAGHQPIQAANGFRWENGSMTSLGAVVPNGYSRGHGINDSGAIVGRASLGEFNTSEKHMVNWDASNALTSVPNSGGSIYSTAQDINNAGIIVGNGFITASEQLGMVWDSDDNFLHWIDTFGGIGSRGWAINNDGTVIGFGTDASEVSHALVSYDNGATSLKLSDMIIDFSGWQRLQVANDINENGDIVGIGVTASGQNAAFIATVVPVPAAVWLFGSALAGLFGFRRLRS